MVGCSGRSGKAVVDDYPGGGGYKIVSVDSGSPVRVSSWIVDCIPYVLVSPGSHTFSVTTLRGAGQFVFNATVAADRTYRVVSTASGNLTFVEVKP
jgi:hypothetical protein